MEFFIMNGDYIYEQYRRNASKPYEVDLFRKDYKYHMEKATGMATFFRYVPTMFMYDDHETYSDLVGTNQKNASVYGFDKIKDTHTLKVHPSFRSDEKANYGVGSRHYYDWKVSNSHFIVLDIRGERTRYIPEKAHDEDRFLLGETQREWLVETIKQSEAEFIFIFTTVSWMMYHTDFYMYASGKSEEEPKLVDGRSVKEDGFTGAVKERDKLLDF